jgi:hypothetical protein
MFSLVVNMLNLAAESVGLSRQSRARWPVFSQQKHFPLTLSLFLCAYLLLFPFLLLNFFPFYPNFLSVEILALCIGVSLLQSFR